MKVLVTAGATREPIDQVRFITNHSTGRTSAAMADHFLANGHTVTYVHAESARLPGHDGSPRLKTRSFATIDDLDTVLRNELGQTPYDLIIHAAAVADYAVGEVQITEPTGETRMLSPDQIGKIDSNGQVTLRLKRNMKIISRLREYAAGISRPVIVGFKLTVGAYEEQAHQALLRVLEHADLVVHNDWIQMRTGDQRAFAVYAGHRTQTSPSEISIGVQLVSRPASIQELSHSILSVITGKAGG
jgi:phosphopantothenate--cysteine ligase